MAADEIDLPPGIPSAAAGSGGADTSRNSVAAFRASGQPDLTKFLSPVPPSALPSTTPASSPTASYLERAKNGLLSIIGITPSATVPPTPITIPVTNTRTSTLEKGLDDLERRSTTIPTSPVYEARLNAYSSGATSIK